MERSISEFVKGATNVYRTDCYIVRQQVKLLYDKQYGSYLLKQRYVLSLHAETGRGVRRDLFGQA